MGGVAGRGGKVGARDGGVCEGKEAEKKCHMARSARVLEAP